MLTSADNVGGWVKKRQNHADVILEQSLSNVDDKWRKIGKKSWTELICHFIELYLFPLLPYSYFWIASRLWPTLESQMPPSPEVVGGGWGGWALLLATWCGVWEWSEKRFPLELFPSEWRRGCWTGCCCCWCCPLLLLFPHVCSWNCSVEVAVERVLSGMGPRVSIRSRTSSEFSSLVWSSL